MFVEQRLYIDYFVSGANFCTHFTFTSKRYLFSLFLVQFWDKHSGQLVFFCMKSSSTSGFSWRRTKAHCSTIFLFLLKARRLLCNHKVYMNNDEWLFSVQTCFHYFEVGDGHLLHRTPSSIERVIEECECVTWQVHHNNEDLPTMKPFLAHAWWALSGPFWSVLHS